MYEIYVYLRDEKGVKDATVAKATGIGKSTFSDWKNGRSAPKGEKLKKIAEYFGVSTQYLLTGDPRYRYTTGSDKPRKINIFGVFLCHSGQLVGKLKKRGQRPAISVLISCFI